jgi:hypothetical protein
LEPESINQLLRKQPFQPFRITLSNGKCYDIVHPELAMVGRRDLLVGTPASGYRHPVYSTFDIVAFLHIDHVHMLPQVNRPETSAEPGV